MICTLISEALSSDKSWDEIKDLLHLKNCNLDIHTSVSHFTEIQQEEKESLVAYIQRFKREANRCNFNNNAATVQIFIKGLKNAHNLAAQIYKHGPQTLADAIREVEKLQAAQQLTTNLLPLSTVNVMSSKDDKCFQYQESGHMAHHCPNRRCFDCDEYGHVAADCPNRIPPSGTPAHHRKHDSSMRHQTRSMPKPCHRDRHRFSRSKSHSHTHRYRSHNQNNSHRSHSRSSHRCPHKNTSHHWYSNPYHYWCDTPHRRSSSHRSSSTQSRDGSRCRPHTLNKANQTASSKPSYSSSKTALRHQDNKYKRVTIDDPISLLQYWWPIQWFWWGFKLREPSLSTAPHKWEGPRGEEIITVACIMDCPTITVHAGKCYNALIDLGATISLLRYSTYKKIEDCYKTPIQPTTAKLNTADGSPMSALGMTALHLRIAEFKFTHNFIICNWLPDTELIFGIDIQKSSLFPMLGTKKMNCYIQKKENS